MANCGLSKRSVTPLPPSKGISRAGRLYNKHQADQTELWRTLTLSSLIVFVLSRGEQQKYSR